MDALKMLLIVVAISVAVAALGGLLVSVALDPLERMRQRWLAAEASEKQRKPRVTA
jgi:hypothetical protein